MGKTENIEGYFLELKDIVSDLIELRNPFKLLSSERIKHDETFLQLFGPGILDILPKDYNWDIILPIRSAPGGGKTSILRLFTPQSLTMLIERGELEDYRDLYQRLIKLNVISPEGPTILGVYITCNQNYGLLEDLDISTAQQNRLFFSLLNSRIIIAALKGLIRINKLRFPDDLDSIIFNASLDVQPPITFPCNGAELFSWAANNEMSILRTIDSFIPEGLGDLIGHDTLYCLKVIQQDAITINDSPLDKRVVLLLDDIHNLSSLQRELILKNLYNYRPQIGILYAERLEALSSTQLLTEGIRLDREYSEPVTIEQYWRAGGRRARFQSLLTEIANKRTKLARDTNDIQINNFETCLIHHENSREWQRLYANASDNISKRILERTKHTKTYDNWIEIINSSSSIKEKATLWRTLEIIIDRGRQKKLIDVSLPVNNIDRLYNSNIKNAAEYFISKEFNIPYYYGFSQLVKMCSWNIEQFIYIASHLFEESISAVWLTNNPTISPKNQELIIKNVAKKIWDEIPRNIPNSRLIIHLLENIRDLCLEETEKKNAPYAPGVTGIGIRRSDIDRIIDRSNQKESNNYALLAQIISTCISNNIFEAYTNRRQGVRNSNYVILYLNRMFCVHFGLPLHYGGWKRLRINDLLNIMRKI